MDGDVDDDHDEEEDEGGRDARVVQSPEEYPGHVEKEEEEKDPKEADGGRFTETPTSGIRNDFGKAHFHCSYLPLLGILALDASGGSSSTEVPHECCRISVKTSGMKLTLHTCTAVLKWRALW